MSNERPGGPSDGRHWTVAQTQNHLSRRRFLAAAGGVAAGSTALAVAGSEEADAAVAVDTLSVPDRTFEADAVEPVLDATIAYEYAVSDANGTVVELRVGGESIASQESMTSIVEGSDTVSLSGRVTDAGMWESADFDPASGGTLTQTVDVSVYFAVTLNGSVVAEDTATDTATITVDAADGGTVSVGGKVTIRTATQS